MSMNFTSLYIKNDYVIAFQLTFLNFTALYFTNYQTLFTPSLELVSCAQRGNTFFGCQFPREGSAEDQIFQYYFTLKETTKINCHPSLKLDGVGPLDKKKNPTSRSIALSKKNVTYDMRRVTYI